MRPNIVYLHSHDTGRAIEPYGYAVPAPNLRRLAEGGVTFRQAYAAAPTCSPSRAALLTGQSPHQSGMLGLAHRGFRLHDYGQHLVHTLRGAGYTSTLVGFQHLHPDPAMLGYDRVASLASTDTADVAPAAAAWLVGAPREPFFLDIGFTETHREFPDPGPAEDPRWLRPFDPLPDTPETRRDMAAYHASARQLDAGVGVVLDALDDAGLAANTLVLCTTDHGPAFPGMKGTLTGHGLGVLLIMRGPGGFVGGRVLDGLVSHVDVFPTLCDLLGIAAPDWLGGRSLLPLVRGEVEEVNGAIFAEVTYHAAYEPQRAVRTQRWNYVRRFGDRTAPVLPNTDDGPSKDLWLRSGWRERPEATEHLYDLVFDPAERSNLAGDPRVRGELAEARARLAAWMAETDDPLLAGPVPLPPGVEFTNDPDAESPAGPVLPVVR